jgi:phosphoglycolate phosphatase
MKLILFDIDGTLIWPDGAGRAAMERALTEIFGLAGPTTSLPMAGKTDRQIITELLIGAGLDQATIQARLPECFQAITRHMAQTTRQRQIRVCPGVPALLAQLSEQPEAVLGLLTGNLATSAPIKLRAANLDPTIFCVGAYGNDAADRSQLPAVAINRAQALTGYVFEGKNVVIIGDTPADVTCGQHLDVTAVGVATGSYPLEALRAAGADYVFPDLTGTDQIMQAIL